MLALPVARPRTAAVVVHPPEGVRPERHDRRQGEQRLRPAARPHGRERQDRPTFWVLQLFGDDLFGGATNKS